MASYDDIPDFGVLYDSVPAYNQRPDVAFYVEEARRAGGHVLELGCGTGRILLPIARAGIAIAGIDGSVHMLERCREKLRGEPEPVQARVALHQGDARDFDLRREFALVIAPFRVVQHQVTIDDQLRFLASVARHLAPGGRLVFDVFVPAFARMALLDDTEMGDTPETRLADGRLLRRTVRVRRIRWLDQVSEVELIYYITPPGKPEERFVQAFDMRWFTPAELTHLLTRAGFREVAHYGDFDRGALTERSSENIVCAELIPSQ